jgi:acetyl esterase/lipase
MYFTSPINFVSKLLPPTLIQAGDCDEVVPFRNSVELAERIGAVCGKDRVRLDIIKGALHGDPAFNTPENQNVIFAFLDACLK